MTDLILSFPLRPKRKYCLMICPKYVCCFFLYKKTVWIPILGSGLMVSGTGLKFTFYSKTFLSM